MPDFLAGFDETIAAEIEKYHTPGLAVAIVHKGEVVLSKGYGLRDVDKKLPVTPETVFAIGSCTKAFTALALAQLVEDGKLDWDKPVRNYVPEFKLYDPFASAEMTPRDLVCHRSGLPRHDFAWYGSSATRAELVERLQYLQPSQPFRYVFQYQNLMYMMAGYLVEQVAGVSWEEFTQTWILDKLGMSSSNLSVEESKKIDNAALPYSYKDDQIKEIPFRNIDAIGPAGSINSNLVDMVKWLKMHMAGDETLLPKAKLKALYDPHVFMPILPENPAFGYGEIGYTSYALGWAVQMYRGHRMIRHTGGIDGFITSVSFLPDDDLGVIVFGNQSGTDLPVTVTLNIYDRFFGLDMLPWSERIQAKIDEAKAKGEEAKAKFAAERTADAPPSHPLADYVGDYAHPGYGVVSVTQSGDSLQAKYNGFNLTVTHYHYDTFEMKDEDFDLVGSFSTNPQGKISQLTLPIEPMVAPIVFTRGG